MTIKVKPIFYFLYIMYLYVFLDSLLAKPALPAHTFFYVIYLLILGFLILYIAMKKSGRLKVNKSKAIIIVLFFFYLYEMLHFYGSIDEILAGIIMVSIIYVNYQIVVWNNCLFQYVLISYIIPTIFLAYVCWVQNINIFDKMRNVNIELIFLSLQRYRVDFGFYNINGTGNLCACVICISFFLLGYIKNKKIKTILKFFLYLLIGLSDLCITIILLLTNSRTAILTVIIAFLVLISCKALLRVNYNKIIKHIIEFSIFACGVICICFFLGDNIQEMFVTSGRAGNIAGNLEVLNNPFKKIFGVGAVSPGTFSGGSILGVETYTLDNYYLYIFIIGGVFGLTIIMSLFSVIGKSIYKEIMNSEFYCILFGNFVALLISGMGETCVLYPFFPSSIIFMSLFLIAIDERVRKSIINAIST